MDYHKPTFLDVQRREVVARIVEKDGIPVLSIDQIQEDGSLKRLLLLNSIDAQQLTSVCEIYLKQVYSSELNGNHVGLSPEKMLAIFGESE